ncbi:acetylglutamate kinase [Iodidimonas nitroreducens]|uniref:Acetylglutamate kinase n=1 Tax=Iodidimonas nitroreducens TaxID=1236968 RepID=A0A5A7N5S7_9PROT|nr:acetylglutamate kinase [Iodidimonas nitroreducens]GAK32462.1 acetylglutamate kinase [alpha proteobacterium Q-1]GER02770.1 acetylglutamate kinase [Iodidimonas nitroreducens]
MNDQDFSQMLQDKAAILSEALPYMRRYAGKTFVVKYGGHAMGDAQIAQSFAQDMVLLRQVGINIVVVHGGGPQIGAMLDRLKIQSRFVDGLRVTDAATVEVVEMVLSGSINKGLVAAISHAGGMAVGLSGKDGGFVRARAVRRKTRLPGSAIEEVLDLGFVGEPEQVDGAILSRFIASGLIPVIAPIGLGEKGETFNINADTMAGAVAQALGAERFLLLTDVQGILDAQQQHIPEISHDDARALIASGTISGGMIPKVETCLSAVENGVAAAVIMNGRVPHASLLEIFTERGVGTLIRAPKTNESRVS